MMIPTLQALTVATAGCAVLFGGGNTLDPDDPAKFKKPVRIKAGGQFLGEGRLYPSPAMQDVNGDQVPDLVIGDLFGHVTFAPGATARGSFGAEVKLKDEDGQPLKFDNW